MNRFWILFIIFFLGISPISAQSEVLLRVEGRDVSVSAFKRFCAFSKTGERNKEFIDYCFRLFVYEQLKITDALSAGWDTLPVFKQLCKVETGEKIKSLLGDEGYRELGENKFKCIVPGRWVKIKQISILLPQYADKSAERSALCKLDSVYYQVEGGRHFEDFCTADAEWIPAYGLLKEFSEQLSGMVPGQISRPFTSPLGVHLLKLDAYSDSPLLSDNSSYTNRYTYEGCDKIESDECFEDSLKYGRLYNETRDSLLVRLWEHKYVCDQVVEPSSDELESFFLGNKKRYAWDFPHFKGAIIHCSSKKEASNIRKRLKQRPMNEWEETIKEWNAEFPASKVVIDIGLFRIGTNPYVDKLAFKCGELPSDARYSYSFVYGKRLKKEPENYLDVLELVRKDFLLSKERNLIEDLKKRYRIEINRNILDKAF